MSDFKAKMHQIIFRTPLGSLQRCPDSLARFKGPTSKEKEGESMEWREVNGALGEKFTTP